jgi:hypothetical protein
MIYGLISVPDISGSVKRINSIFKKIGRQTNDHSSAVFVPGFYRPKVFGRHDC